MMRGRGAGATGILPPAAATAGAAALALSAFLVPAGARGSPGSLAALLRAQEPHPGVAMSLLFAPVCGAAAETRVALDPDRALPPASVQKIVTSAAALDLLGPDRRFLTRLLADRPPRAGRVDGDLYLTGDGDPFLVSERLWLLAQDAAAAGLTGITGSLVVDASVVADLDSIRGVEQTDSPYAAPVSRLALNFNSLTFLIRPAAAPGSKAAALLDPIPIPTVSITNTIETVVRSQARGVTAARASRGAIEVWTLSGSVPAGDAPSRIYRSCRSPALLAGGTLAGMLEQRGIAVPAVREGAPPEGAVELASLPSLTLGSLIRSMNLWSNNFMADLLLVDLGGGGSGREGVARIQAWLADRGASAPAPTIADGCGLSPRNRISAGAIVAILLWAHGQERVFPDLYASFPRPGGEGTLARRFRDAPVVSLRAKTGTLGEHGVSSIAGYVDRPGGERYAFCILQQAAPGAGLSVADLRAREEGWLEEFVAP